MLTNEYILLQNPVHVSIQIGFATDPWNGSLRIWVVEICQYFIPKHPYLSNFIFHAPHHSSQHVFPGLLQTILGSGVRTGNNIMVCILSAWICAGPRSTKKE